MRTHMLLGAFGIAVIAVALTMVGLGSVSASETSVGRDGVPLAPAATIVVTSTADSGPGTLRQALLDAVNGDVINFDTGVFPPSSPQTITLGSALPEMGQGNLTIDGGNAGVILDGSGIGTSVETQLFDTISLTMDGGPNLLINGDFDAGMGHWRPWDEWETPARTLNTSDFRSAPNALQWSGHVRQSWSRTVYDTDDTSALFSSWPFEPGSSAWISATGGSTVEINLWYRGGFPSVDLAILYSDDGTEEIHWDLGQETAWTTATLTHTLPGNAIAVGLDLQHYHTEQWSSGLSIHSNNNTIRGLQIVGFPDNGIYLGEGTQGNVIGGDRSVGAGPLGQGNLLSANGSIGVNIYGSNGNSVSGNTIGTDVDGSSDLGNRLEGISINEGASNNLIGGDTPGERNLISGNDGPGVWIGGIGTMSNTVSGNYIGTDVTGTVAIGNEHSGIHIEDGGSYNLIGGDTPAERNLISGNQIGISMAGPDTHHNTVSGNYIGTNVSGTAAVANASPGAHIYGGASYNLIGGDTPGERNLISGNGGDGVDIDGSGTMSNTVRGNYIGTNVSGTAELGNAYRGVFVLEGAQYNTISDNLISGNGNDGVPVEGVGTMYNVVSGNYIGTDSSGTAAIGNALDGVYIAYGAQHNLITDNLISGNGQNGVQLRASGTASNTISGNTIGTDVSGSAALANIGSGVWIADGAQHNIVGGDTPGERNLISGNVGNGVGFEDVGTMSNTVSGNYIGADVSGTVAISNTENGVWIGSGAQHNTIGGDTPGERNLISGNRYIGVNLCDASNNTVSGNYIGTDASGSGDLGNGYEGVSINESSSDNTIGGSNGSPGGACTGACNLISGNDREGIWMGQSGAVSNTISGNYIGTDVSGTAAVGNEYSGIHVEDGGSYNLIGGDTPGGRNLISGNATGVSMAGDNTRHNTVSGNYIGTDVASTGVLPNAWSGVWIGGGAQQNTIGGGTAAEGNLVAHNTAGGVQVHGATTLDNRISHNSIYSNAFSGIDLVDGGNAGLFPPLLTEVLTTVRGIAVPGATVEVFSDAGDQGRWYHGSTIADGSGAFTFTAATPFTGTNVTATATDSDGNTSEFSSPYQPGRDVVVAAVYVPQSTVQVNALLTPTVRVGNGGTVPETFTVTTVITRATDGVQVYSATQTVTDLGVFHYRTLTSASWTPVDLGSYTFEAAVQTIAPDDDTGNDRLTLAFSVADDRVDLWARDNPADDGREPAVGPTWQSPDVWVRNSADGDAEHQDPLNNADNAIYTVVRNRGTVTATDVSVTVYWHDPSLVIAQSWWHAIDTVTLAELAPGGAATVEMTWHPQIPGLTGPYHTCLLGVISSTQDLAPDMWDVRGSNNIIQRNVDIVPQQAQVQAAAASRAGVAGSTVATTTFSVGNPYAGEQLVDVIVDATDVPAGAELWLDLDELFGRWESLGQGSMVGTMVVSGTTQIAIQGGARAEITGIPLTGEELFEVVIEIEGLEGQRVQIDVSERVGGDVIGGITFDVAAVEHKVYLPLVLRSWQ